MTFAPIAYQIATFDGPRPVRGYAVLLPVPFSGLRFCVRRDSAGWCVDHYDTGLGFRGPMISAFDQDRRRLAHVRRWACPVGGREACSRWILRYLHHMRAEKRLRALRDPVWLACLVEAGL